MWLLRMSLYVASVAKHAAMACAVSAKKVIEVECARRGDTCRVMSEVYWSLCVRPGNVV